MRAIFLDRDGVLNRKAPEGEYVTRWEEMEILPDSLEAVVRLAQQGFQILLVTNQRGLALGRVQARDLDVIHQNLSRKLVEIGAAFAGIYVCPHDLISDCACRKPRPGLLLAAAREHNLDLRASWMIGDSATDVMAGRAAGCRTVLISGVNGLGGDPGADFCAETLNDAATQILADNRKFRDFSALRS